MWYGTKSNIFLIYRCILQPPTERHIKKPLDGRLFYSRAPNENEHQTAVLKQRISRPPFFIDTAAKGGCAVSFYIVRPYDLSKKARAPDKDILVQTAKNVVM
jgi:hypothetical protein